MVTMKHGFTLTELLVTMGVLVVLAGLLVPAIGLARQAVRKAQTEALCANLAAAFAAGATSRGTPVPIVPHPLAGSRDLPRWPFVRSEAIAGLSLGDAVATTGEALMCSTPAAMTPAPTTLLLPSDVFAATDQPLLFGLRRDRMTIVGSAAGLQRHRNLPAVSPAYDQNGDGILDPPYTSTRYPDNRFLVSDATQLADLDSESATAVAVALAAGDLQELSAGKRLVSSVNGTLIANGRLYRDGGTSSATWSPGLLRDGGSWVGYRLRGTALYDGWGRELLVHASGDGVVTVMSAGPDGVFRWHPGDDGVFQTSAWSDAPAGDDRDGHRDNISSR